VDRLMLTRTDPSKSALSSEAPKVDRVADPPHEVQASTVPQFVPFSDFTQFAERVIAQIAKDSHWDEKTQRHASSISNLFVKFMVQEQHVHYLNNLLQKHAGAFVDFCAMTFIYITASSCEERATIAKLRVKDLSVTKEKLGIGGDILLTDAYEQLVERMVDQPESLPEWDDDWSEVLQKSRAIEQNVGHDPETFDADLEEYWHPRKEAFLRLDIEAHNLVACIRDPQTGDILRLRARDWILVQWEDYIPAAIWGDHINHETAEPNAAQ